MADDKKGRNKQADDEERRQRKRELEEARDRGDEAEPEPVDDDAGERLGDLDEALEEQEYPTTTEEVIEAHGDHEVEAQEGWKSVDEVLTPVDDETYESADDVRSRIQGLIRRG
ncbi:DUF5789 family protein [Halomontanus rarus]|uniref:DUF5789 family protein n=1 Tax=Halomontanus rarus TaxID=3034020 RepID=UPI0023E86D29|nr:hypothetical protein [Halovivax sp. TS33]